MKKKTNKPRNVLQKNMTVRTSHCLHTSVQTTVTLRLIHVASLCKGVLVIFTSLLSGMWPPALSVMRCVCVLSKSRWTHTEMHDDDRIRPRVQGWEVEGAVQSTGAGRQNKKDKYSSQNMLKVLHKKKKKKNRTRTTWQPT